MFLDAGSIAQHGHARIFLSLKQGQLCCHIQALASPAANTFLLPAGGATQPQQLRAFDKVLVESGQWVQFGSAVARIIFPEGDDVQVSCVMAVVL